MEYPPAQGDEDNIPPGATVMWFGKYDGTRIDQLDQSYINSLLRLESEKGWPNLVKFKDLYNQHLALLDERQCPLITMKLWFGLYKGENFVQTYFNKSRWYWLLENSPQYKPEMLALEERYLRWQERNPPLVVRVQRARRYEEPEWMDEEEQQNWLDQEDGWPDWDGQWPDDGDDDGDDDDDDDDEYDDPPPPYMAFDQEPFVHKAEEPEVRRRSPNIRHQAEREARLKSPGSASSIGVDHDIRVNLEPIRHISPSSESEVQEIGYPGPIEPATPVRKRKRSRNTLPAHTSGNESTRGHTSSEALKVVDSDSDVIQLPTPSQTKGKSSARHSRRTIILDDSDEGETYPSPSDTGHRQKNARLKVELERRRTTIVLDDGDEKGQFGPALKRRSAAVVLEESGKDEVFIECVRKVRKNRAR